MNGILNISVFLLRVSLDLLVWMEGRAVLVYLAFLVLREIALKEIAEYLETMVRREKKDLQAPKVQRVNNPLAHHLH